MKLYTEEQVVMAIAISIRNEPKHYAEVLEKLTPIELPSEKEIYKNSLEEFNNSQEAFLNGAKWVINHIKQQDNDQ